MTRYVLETNIISNITKPEPSASLLTWMAEQVDEDLHIAACPVATIWRGVLEVPAGRRRQQLETWYVGPEGPPALFAGRILSFDENAGLAWARLMAAGTASGRPHSALDMIIAAIAEANDCVLVTDNGRDFVGIDVITPIRSEARRPPRRGR